MNIRDLLKVYRNIMNAPYQCLLDCGAVDYTDKYDIGDDKLFYIPKTKKGLRVIHNMNDTYSIKILDNFGPKARGVCSYTKAYYGPYQYQDSAYRACVQILKKHRDIK